MVTAILIRIGSLRRTSWPLLAVFWGLMGTVSNAAEDEIPFPIRAVVGTYTTDAPDRFEDHRAPGPVNGVGWENLLQGAPVKFEYDRLTVYISWLPSPRDNMDWVPVIEIFDQHMPVMSRIFSASESVTGSFAVAIADLDPQADRPVVISRVLTGGMQCCGDHTLFFSGPGGDWEQVELPMQYSSFLYGFDDFDHDGTTELVGIDADYQGRYATEIREAAGLDDKTYPLRVFALRKGIVEEWVSP